MPKLKLDLDHLTVDSFDTNADAATQRGTVEAHTALITLFETCPQSCPDTCATCDPSCATCVSCYGTCQNTCGQSCYGTCATCQTNCQQESCVYHCP